MARVVHFTHHLCLVAVPSTNPRERMCELRPLDEPRTYQHDRYRELYPHCRYPETRGAGRVHCLPTTTDYTTDPTATTCRRCAAGLRSGQRETWEARERERVESSSAEARRYGRTTFYTPEHWVPDRELVARTWLLCCRHVTPMPLDLITARTVERFDRDATARRIEREFRHFVDRIFVRDMSSEEHRNHLNDVVESLGDVRERIQPAVNELMVVGDLLERVDELRERARSALKRCAHRVRGSRRLAPLGHYTPTAYNPHFPTEAN